MWEDANIAWELRQSLPEFQARPDEEQDWLRATYRMRNAVSNADAVTEYNKRNA